MHYINSSGDEFYEAEIFEAELKDENSRGIRNGLVKVLGDFLGNECESNKYDIGIRNLK